MYQMLHQTENEWRSQATERFLIGLDGMLAISFGQRKFELPMLWSNPLQLAAPSGWVGKQSIPSPPHCYSAMLAIPPSHYA
jgi:hypothetical protein